MMRGSRDLRKTCKVSLRESFCEFRMRTSCFIPHDNDPSLCITTIQRRQKISPLLPQEPSKLSTLCRGHRILWMTRSNPMCPR